MKNLFILIPFSFILFSCEKVNKPTVTTSSVTDLTWDYITAGGEITDDGGSPVTARGICVTTNESDPPTVINSWNTWYTTDGSGIGSYTSTIKFKYAGAAHTISQEHYFRAYATNSEGTAYGELISVFPHSYPPLFHSIKLINLLSTSITVEFVINLPGEQPFDVDEFYFCYGPGPSPTIDGPHSAGQLDQLGHNIISNLTPNTTYYLRGYVKNESGIAYSPEISFTTYDGILSDINGNVYPFKTYGNQSWMTKNLETTKYNDGSNIPEIPADIYGNWDWGLLTSGATFHGLYNFYAVADSRKLCPSGWHVPSDSEWKSFEVYLGMTQEQADNYGNRGTDEGGKVKLDNQNVTDPWAWIYPNLGATNSSLFSAESTGWRSPEGQYTSIGYVTAFWTCTESNSSSSISRILYFDHAQIARSISDKKYGFSVRCIKD